MLENCCKICFFGELITYAYEGIESLCEADYCITVHAWSSAMPPG